MSSARSIGLILFALLLLAPSAEAQSILARRMAAHASAEALAIDSLVSRHDTPVAGVIGETAFRILHVQRGRPIYYGTHNAASARTIRADAVRTNGGLGLSLDGSGIPAAVWDAGSVYVQHVELAGRVTDGDRRLFTTNHATHVAGTIAASGIEVAARGIAPGVELLTFDWQNDETEMADAAAGGLLVSNHSYGSFGGWVFNLRGTGLWAWMGDVTLSPIEDYRFGYYDQQAREWDEIAASNPNYLIVRSAGNERGESGPSPGAPYEIFDQGWTIDTAFRPADGGLSGYDTILDSGVSKNVLTVGAVRDVLHGERLPSSIEIAPFSGAGPTDDGRIKPDVVASGVSVYSSIASWERGYAYSSGTSMAAPAVTGAAALVQERAVLLRGRPLTSAAMRGLFIHTADEAGPDPGPDYRYGWGLLDVADAAVALNDPHVIIRDDLVLSAGETLSLPVVVGEDGILSVTIAWTDPPAEVPAAGLDPADRLLVNDLDLRVDGAGVAHHPWTLDPDRPSDAAVRGVNKVDNVERVHETDLPPGTYIARITAPDGLSGASQAAAFIAGTPTATAGPGRTIAGLVSRDGVGAAGVQIELSGADFRSSESAPDGSFLFENLEDGAYLVSPNAQFGAPQQSILVPSDTLLRFDAVTTVSAIRVAAFSSDRLLDNGEWPRSTPVSTFSAGGVYGVSLEITASDDLQGGRVELDTSWDPSFDSYIGQRAFSWATLSPEWRISRLGQDQYNKRVPLLWTVPGRMGEAVLPVRIFDAAAILSAVDSIVVVVDRPDDVPPLVYPAIDVAGRGFIPQGRSEIVSVDILDGSPLTAVDLIAVDRESGIQVMRQPMRDDGEFGRSGDRLAADRRFASLLSTPQPMDLRLDIEAVDASGNRAVREGIWYVSSRPFEQRSRVLLATWSETDSQTDALRFALESVRVDVDYWEFDVRGQLRADVVRDYDVLLWDWGARRMDRAEDRALLDTLRSEGQPLILSGSNIAADMDAWATGVTGLEPERIASAEDAFGVDVYSGYDFPIQSAVTLWRGQAESILEAGGLNAAFVTSPGFVVNSVPATALEPTTAGVLLRLLLFAATDDPRFDPATVTGTERTLPMTLSLSEPFPNPTSGATRLALSLPSSSHVSVEAFDALGRRVASVFSGLLQAGTNQIVWNPEVTPGLYFLRVADGVTVRTRSVVLR